MNRVRPQDDRASIISPREGVDHADNAWQYTRFRDELDVSDERPEDREDERDDDWRLLHLLLTQDK